MPNPDGDKSYGEILTLVRDKDHKKIKTEMEALLGHFVSEDEIYEESVRRAAVWLEWAMLGCA